MVRDPRPNDDVARIGLLASLLAYTVAWRLERPSVLRQPCATQFSLPAVYDAILVVQAESFVDLRRLGEADIRLPAFDRLRQSAISAGLIEVASEGAYTLRPESSLITGWGFGEQGFDRFHPYLRPRRFAASALPRLLADAGWDTLFVHPHDGRFFRRRQAMAAFGFDRFADERSFAGARRVGPYVCDHAVGEFLIGELAASAARQHPLFAYVVTMEAHDPYGPGRLPDPCDPIQQYIHHIENADRMLAQLADALARNEQRVLLVFFGDHVPFLPSFADPFSDTRTDYFVVELGKTATRNRVDIEVTRPEHLHALIAQRVKSRNEPVLRQ
jgi:phosphoglycerol transferase MdoB-like AlkP superfamily enzyme